MPHVLIVGGDSLIGRASAQCLRTNGWHVTVTTRRSTKDGAISLSMECLVSDGSPNLQGYDAIVIAAAVTAQADCESHPEISHVVNVEGPKVLARAAMDVGAHVVLLSTNQVLGGNQAFLSTSAPLAPVGAYAQMKAEAEQSLQALPRAVEHLAVLRMTKVLAPNLQLFETWRKYSSGGENVTAFSDLVIAPVSLLFAAKMVALIVETRAVGIFHCSGSEEVSYADLAYAYLGQLGIDPGLVHAIEGREINTIAAASPPHASLAHDNGHWISMIPPQPFAAMLADLIM